MILFFKFNFSDLLQSLLCTHDYFNKKTTLSCLKEKVPFLSIVKIFVTSCLALPLRTSLARDFDFPCLKKLFPGFKTLSIVPVYAHPYTHYLYFSLSLIQQEPNA